MTGLLPVESHLAQMPGFQWDLAGRKPCQQYSARAPLRSRLGVAADDGVSLSAQESERLELMNAELKTQIEELKLERQQLILMLNRHRPTCIVRTDSVRTPESEGNPLLEQLDKK